MGGAARTRVLDLAATQCGLFADRQAIELGIGRAALRSWARCGEIERVLPHVWGVAGAPDTDDRRAMAAVLSHGPGAVLAILLAHWGYRPASVLFGKVLGAMVGPARRTILAAGSAIERVDGTLRQWPAAGLSLLAVAILLGAAMLAR